MTKQNHHKRKNYEAQYVILCNFTDSKPINNLKSLSDYQLLTKTNEQLIKLNLIPYTDDELEIILD